MTHFQVVIIWLSMWCNYIKFHRHLEVSLLASVTLHNKSLLINFSHSREHAVCGQIYLQSTSCLFTDSSNYLSVFHDFVTVYVNCMMGLQSICARFSQVGYLDCVPLVGYIRGCVCYRAMPGALKKCPVKHPGHFSKQLHQYPLGVLSGERCCLWAVLSCCALSFPVSWLRFCPSENAWRAHLLIAKLAALWSPLCMPLCALYKHVHTGEL